MKTEPKVGDTIRIIEMKGEPTYTGREGIIEYIDDAGQIHFSGGFLAIIPNLDKYKILKSHQKSINSKIK